MMNEVLTVADNFLPSPEKFREFVLQQKFIDYKAHDGELYKRVSPQKYNFLNSRIEELVGFKIKVLMSGARLNFKDELPNRAIHADVGFGEFASVFYLSRPEDCKGGTAFWQHKTLGIDAAPEPITAEFVKQISPEWERPDNWDLAGFVAMKFNRFITYPTRFFHSRYPFEAFGETPKDGRLIFVVFYDRLKT